MKNCIFLLILLGFLRLVFTCNNATNISATDDSDYACPYTLFRRKRANAEYTRWRANMATTPQFIVKVLDEEITTPAANSIVAFNIMPAPKRGEKIIIGGAVVPPPTTAKLSPEEEESSGLREYTRFVPPTTAVATRAEDDIYIAPALSPQLTSLPAEDDLPLKPSTRFPPHLPQMQYARPHALRDESPPSGPQFIPRREPLALARQFAPIAPVAFNRRTAMAPVTPRSQEDDIYRPKPTKSFTYSVPSSDEYILFNTYPEEDVSESATRTTTETPPIRSTTSTTPTTQFVYDDPFEKITPKKLEIYDADTHDDRPKEHTTKKSNIERDRDMELVEKDVEATYNNLLFDNNEYVQSSEYKNKSNDILDEEQSKSVEKDDTLRLVGSENSIDEKTNRTTTIVSQEHSDYDIDTKRNVSVDFLEPPVATAERPRNKKCSLIKRRTLSFNSPRTLPEIIDQLEKWAEDSPVARWVDITEGNRTTMENSIYMMIVDDPSNGQIMSAKHTVMIVAGIQGRDHHAVAAAMYMLYQLIERSEAHTDLLTKYRFWIIPVFNPDGYDYSMTFPHRREWSKNLRQSWDACKGRDSCKFCESHGLRCTVQPCYGVNLDRNFEYQWIPAEKLKSEHPCGSLYAGVRQLSEAETKALTNYLHDRRPPLHTFVALKEGDVLGIMYPYSHTKKKRAFDNIHRQRSSRAAAAAYSISGRPYVAGQTSEFLSLYAGGIEDWVDSHLGIDNTYTIMMFRPTDAYNSRLITERAVHESYAALDTLLLQAFIDQPAPEPQRPRVQSDIPSGTVRLTRKSTTSKARTKHSNVILLAVLQCFVYLR